MSEKIKLRCSASLEDSHFLGINTVKPCIFIFSDHLIECFGKQ